jgi:hypothetical protein
MRLASSRPDELSDCSLAAGSALVVVEAENVAEHNQRFAAHEHR